MTAKETLTLNQKTMDVLQTQGNEKSGRIAHDHKMVIEYYERERERYIRETKSFALMVWINLQSIQATTCYY